MFDKYFDRLSSGENARSVLISLREEMKESIAGGSVRIGHIFSEEQENALAGLLKSDDAKTRRNAALILGEAGARGKSAAVMAAYEKEEQLFVRSSYLKALKDLDWEPYRGKLEERMRQIEDQAGAEGSGDKAENSKHLSEELAILRGMLLKDNTPEKHVFTGYNIMSDVVLLTSAGLEKLTLNALPDFIREGAKVHKGAVEVSTDKFSVVSGIRTVKGFLFRFMPGTADGRDPAELAGKIARAGIVRYLKTRHRGTGAFYFRVDLRQKKACSVICDPGKYIRNFSSALERASSGQLKNSASFYEAELRLVEGQNGKFAAFLKLYTFDDSRFSYRRKTLSSSTGPVRAAEVCALARDYMDERAAVLDPFCGTGTLLFERGRAAGFTALYGVDIFGEAIKGANENAEVYGHGRKIYFVTRDFRDFTHDRPFDEIITELPSAGGKLERTDIVKLYAEFAEKAAGWAVPGGRMIALTAHPDLLRKAAKVRGLAEKESFEIPGSKGQSLIIFTL
ncbi:MAG: methyltransferase domain-containing protein [Lachnospiraceae bacterium]|nr:methyltransferase domain-containing protein [Lachnospiraceae bacterium]